MTIFLYYFISRFFKHRTQKTCRVRIGITLILYTKSSDTFSTLWHKIDILICQWYSYILETGHVIHFAPPNPRIYNPTPRVSIVNVRPRLYENKLVLACIIHYTRAYGKNIFHLRPSSILMDKIFVIYRHNLWKCLMLSRKTYIYDEERKEFKDLGRFLDYFFGNFSNFRAFWAFWNRYTNTTTSALNIRWPWNFFLPN